jgi:hypothetical protein
MWLSHPNPEASELKTPPRPTLVATALLSLWVVVLSLPMLVGKWLAGPWSDQYATGYAFRAWGAEQFRATGGVALWNPELFGGLPFVAAQHGDIFYWTSWFRLILPTEVVMNLGFVIHYIAAGLFVYLLLRLLGVSWLGSVVGGMAYQLSGVVGSYPAPGHDGKLFVTALLPLALIALVLALRSRRWEGYGLLALTVGLALLSPHYQMTYYLLIAAGLFALYLTFGEPTEEPLGRRVALLGLALGAVLLGFGIAMIQVIPFYHYIPWSPRATGYYGFEGSTSYAIPWVHVPEFFLSRFVGAAETYWGSNPLKLHSEYLGLSVVALAALGAAGGARRRLSLWLGGVGLLFLLVCLGSATPFYRVWWTVMPFVKQTRAPGMALFVVALIVSLFAAFGAERLQRGEGRRHVHAWLGTGAAVVLLGLAGAFGGLAEGLAKGLETSARSLASVSGAKDGIGTGAVWSGVALLALGALTLLRLRGKAALPVFLAGLPLLVGADLFLNARPFWIYSAAPRDGLYAPDPITERLAAEPKPLRVLNLNAYPGSSLMAFGIPQLLGHHGNELHNFDELLGGKNQWRFLGSPRVWDILGIQYVATPAGQIDADPGLAQLLAGYERVVAGARTAPGEVADLFQRSVPVPYGRLVPAAVKVPNEQAIPVIVDPRTNFDPARVVLLAPESSVEPAAVSDLPDPLDVSVQIEQWRPGAMRLRISPAAPQDAYLVVSENWYPDWQGRVDGRPVPVVRGDVSLITVPVPTGAEIVELELESGDYRLGKWISIASLTLVVAGIVIPVAQRRRRERG